MKLARLLSWGSALAAGMLLALGVARADSDFTMVCLGDGGDQAGCTPCPCGNEAPIGSGGGCLNASGFGAVLLPSGTASVSADTLRFAAIHCEPGGAAILMSGSVTLPVNPANPCAGLDSGIQSASFDGLRCVGGNVLRHGIRGINASGAIGTTPQSNGWGPPDNPAGGLMLHGAFVAGETRTFQVIFRTNPTLTCGNARNSTQGVEVTIEP